MDLPETAPDPRPRFSKRTLIIAIALLALFTGGVYVVTQIRPIASSHILSMLKDSGFHDAQIGSLLLSPSGLQARDIKLDQYGFDKIDTLSAGLSWPAFLASGKISNLEINGVSLTRTSSGLGSSSRQLAANLLKLPDHRISLSNVTLDMDTGFGALRLTMDATAEPGKDQGTHNIQAHINANQYQLGFQSEWQGTLSKDGMLDLAGNVLEGRANLGPLRISRFNGWAGASIGAGGYTLQSQLEAGSATFMGVPLQNISIVSDSNAARDDVMIRSGVSGIPDVLFTADLASTEQEQSFSANLKGKNFGGLLDYIDEAKKTKKEIGESLLSLRNFEFNARFQPEKRFVGGPMPFGLSLVADEQKILDGNILFYPDTFEVRGSLETKEDTAQGLQDYFKIPSANIIQNFIRLDGDTRNFFGVETREQNIPEN